MRPGRTVSEVRSIILAAGGMVTLLPTASIFPSRIRIVWLVSTMPESGSISLPARMAVTWADAGRSREQQVARTIRKKRKAKRNGCSIIFFVTLLKAVPIGTFFRQQLRYLIGGGRRSGRATLEIAGEKAAEQLVAGLAADGKRPGAGRS